MPFGFIITKSNKFGFITLKGNAKGMRNSSSNVHHRLREIITERRDAMSKSLTPLNVDLLHMLLSVKDEDDTITDDTIKSTIYVSYSSNRNHVWVIRFHNLASMNYFYTCLRNDHLSTSIDKRV